MLLKDLSRKREVSQSQRIDEQKRAEEWQDTDEKLINKGKVRDVNLLFGFSHVFWLVFVHIAIIFSADVIDMFNYNPDIAWGLILGDTVVQSFLHPIELWKYFLAYLSIPLFVYLDFSYTKSIKNKLQLRIESGLRNYKIKKIKDNRVYIELENGKEINFEQVERSAPLISQRLGFQTGFLVEEKGKWYQPYKAYIEMTSKLPTAKEGISGDVSVPSSKFLRDDSLLIGVNDKNGSPVYTTQTNDKGRLQQHGMVVGGSGSGKSFFITKTLFSNFFDTKEHYFDYSNITIIDFKDSGDYEEFKQYSNVNVFDGDPKKVLSVFKDVEIERRAREKYMRENNLKTGDLPKYIFMIDEVQTIMENMASKQSRLMMNTWNNISALLNTLTAKARSSNITIIVALQKATVESISSTVRSNIGHRFLMKNDNMSMLINEDLMREMGIKPKEMEQGQFYYSDIITGNTIIPSFAVPMPKLLSKDLAVYDDENVDFKNAIRKYKLEEVDKYENEVKEMAELEESGAIDLSSEHLDYSNEDSSIHDLDYVKSEKKEPSGAFALLRKKRGDVKKEEVLKALNVSDVLTKDDDIL